jgi:hypothetical protein
MRPARIAALAGTAAVTAVASALATGTPALAAAQSPVPVVLHVGQIAEQDVAPAPGSEPDTLVEPDIAVSPTNPMVAVAAAHDGRFANGGAVGISYAWTHDGGRTWHHQALPGVTKAVGGEWDRASDPVVAFGPDGSVYISVLLISLDCPSGVGVSRSTDGGMTFGPPMIAHRSDDCAFSDDKNWLVVDNSPRSPHRGRLYQFWTPFLSDAQGNDAGNPQVLRWSDDQGRTWGPIVTVSDPHASTQNSQPMILPDGTIVDTYLDFGSADGGETPEHPSVEGQAGTQVSPQADEPGTALVARTSHDGGATWSPEVLVTDDVGEGPDDVRCCLPSATSDPLSGRMYVAWNSVEPDTVAMTTSTDGRHWSEPVRVNHDPVDGLEHINVDVTAFADQVYVSYGTRDLTVADGRFVQQQVSVSRDRGAHFGPPTSVGPLSDLAFAAQSRGFFPGDYIGSAATHGRVYLAWALSAQPADPTARFRQTLFGAVLAG